MKITEIKEKISKLSEDNNHQELEVKFEFHELIPVFVDDYNHHDRVDDQTVSLSYYDNKKSDLRNQRSISPEEFLEKINVFQTKNSLSDTSFLTIGKAIVSNIFIRDRIIYLSTEKYNVLEHC